MKYQRDFAGSEPKEIYSNRK